MLRTHRTLRPVFAVTALSFVFAAQLSAQAKKPTIEQFISPA